MPLLRFGRTAATANDVQGSVFGQAHSLAVGARANPPSLHMAQPSAERILVILVLKPLRMLHARLGKRLREVAEGAGFIAGPSTTLGTNGFPRGHRPFSAFIASSS